MLKKYRKYAIPGYSKNHNVSVNLEDVLEERNFCLGLKEKLPDQYQKTFGVMEKEIGKGLEGFAEQGTAVLVHGDIHWENIMQEDGKITGITDWDVPCQAPPDYELWKIIDYHLDPTIYVEEKLESVYARLPMEKDFALWPKHYPELFKLPELLSRIRMYFAENTIWKVGEYLSGKTSDNAIKNVMQRIEKIYASDWLYKILFKK